MQKTAFKGTLLACCVALSGASFAGTPSAEMLAATCYGCHGPNGNSKGPATPSIAGASAFYFEDVMQQYKEGERASTIMTRIAKGYSKEEIQAMAEFFAKQEFEAGTQMADAAQAKAGAELHDKYCEKCHAEGGTSSEDDAGILAGQWKPYLTHAMTDFLSGDRDMPRKMKRKIEKMQKKKGEDSIDKLLHFYASKK